MKEVHKFKRLVIIRLGIVKEFIFTLWKYKMWWALPIIIIILLLTVFLLIVGYSGVGVIIYPLI